jgi:DNA-binding transcriptional LysR family regulator
MNKFAAFHTFVTAAEQGSFTAAARKLGTSASTVTKMIGRLEDDLGARLFNRTTRQLALTEHGQDLFDRAQKILSEVEEAEGLLRQATGAARGTVRIVVPFLFGRMTLVPALPIFFERYPEVKMQVHFSDRPVDLIESGFDCGVHTGEMSDSAAIRRILTRGPQITAASPAYLEKHGEPQTPDDLHGHNCLYGRFGTDWSFRSPQGTKQRIRVNGNLAVFNGDSLREAAVQGLGITHSTWWALRHDLERGTLKQILSDYVVEGQAVSVVYPAGRHLPARVRVVIDFLVEITSVKGARMPMPS